MAANMGLRWLAPLLVLLAPAAAVEGDECALTSMQPRRPRYLKFCQDYNDNACCIPGHDLENQIQFDNLIDGLGPGCKNPMMYPAVRYFYCLGCDPEQPKVTHPKADGGSGSEVWICKEFEEMALWSENVVEQYNECGMMKPTECPAEMPNFDPYTCGDDLVIPTIEWGNATVMMNYLKPPGMPSDHEYVVVDEADVGEGNCWKPVSMRAGRARNSASRATWSATLGVVATGLALRRFL